MKDTRNLNRRASGISVKINSFRLEVGLRKIPHSDLKPLIIRALKRKRYLCPICLRSVSSLIYARHDKGWCKYSTVPICRVCFKKMTAKVPLEILDVRFREVDER